MKKYIVIILCLCTLGVAAQETPQAPVYSKAEVKAAQKWVKGRSWAGSFAAASPSKMTDVVAFKQQYEKNKVVWDAVFEWLQTNDLYSMPAGKYYVCDSVLIRVMDGKTRPVEQCQVEMHKKIVDFQWTIRGTEGYALYTRTETFPVHNYDKKKDLCRFEIRDGVKGRHMTSNPQTFFLFFPTFDVHQAMMQAKSGPAPIRKIVAKIPVK